MFKEIKHNEETNGQKGVRSEEEGTVLSEVRMNFLMDLTCEQRHGKK